MLLKERNERRSLGKIRQEGSVMKTIYIYIHIYIYIYRYTYVCIYIYICHVSGFSLQFAAFKACSFLE